MVFECLDCPFSWVGPVVSWGGQFVLKVFSFSVCNQFLGDFSIKAEELGAKPTALQIIMAMFESPEHFKCGSVLDGNGIDEVAISIKHDKQIFVAPEGGDWIATWEIRGNEVLEFLVRRGVDYFISNVPSTAHKGPLG